MYVLYFSSVFLFRRSPDVCKKCISNLKTLVCYIVIFNNKVTIQKTVEQVEKLLHKIPNSLSLSFPQRHILGELGWARDGCHDAHNLT